MPDAPEIVLNRALAHLLHDHDLAVYDTNRVVERGVRIDGVMPTTVQEFTLLTPLIPISEGRADVVYRTQAFTRRKGTIATVREWSANLRAVLDHQSYTPQVLGISWAWEFSATDFAPGTTGYADTVATYYFRGRRP